MTQPFSLPGFGNTPQLGANLTSSSAPQPTSQAPSDSSVGAMVSAKLQQARQQYPSADDQILQAFIKDNQKTLPSVVDKVQGFMSNARTARNNNPTALTTSVAQALGGKEGVDYTKGDPFSTSSGGTLYTAKLNGDPIQATVNLFDKAASNNIPIFDTGSGTPRWSYVKDISNQQWSAMSPAEKQATVTAMQVKESGSKPAYSATQILDSLIKDNQTTQVPQVADSGTVSTDDMNPLHEIEPGLQFNKLGGQLGQRGQDIQASLADPNAKWWDKGLQTIGSIAGGLGDTISTAAEAIPGVKAIEDGLGIGVTALANTSGGQAVLGTLNNFAQAHPELAKNMDAGFNILTAIPVLKGLSVVKDVALDAASSALKSVAQKSAVTDLTEVLSRTVGGRNALASVPEGLSTLIKNNAIPDFVTEGNTTRYATKDAFETMGKRISEADDKLQGVLEKANVPQVANRIPLSSLRETALQQAKDELKPVSGINEMFDRIQEKYGDYPSLQQVNDAKRTVSRQISETMWGSPEMNTNKMVRQSLQKGVEEGAHTLGLDDVAAINQQEMAPLIKAQDMLSSIDGKAVKVRGGFLHSAIKIGSVASGAGIGSLFGGMGTVPGALAGGAASDYIENKLMGLTPKVLGNRILQKTAPDAVRAGLGTLTPALTKIGTGLAARKINGGK